MEIQVKKIDNLVITVVNGSVFSITLPEGQDGAEIFDNILDIKDKLNSGLIVDEQEINFLKSELYSLISPEQSKEYLKQKAQKEAIKKETDIFIQGDTTLEQRFENATRIKSIDNRFEHDSDGYIYLKGYDTPIPQDLVTSILDATYNPDSQYTLESLINFWQWVILNPNKEARMDLFKWFKTGGFSITEEGMVVAYRCVAVKKQALNKELEDFISRSFTKIKKWKKSPKNFAIMEDYDSYKLDDLKKNPKSANSHDFLGTVSDLYADINNSEGSTIYTDNYSKTFNIKIGEEVSMERSACDPNRNADCSRGLHFMSKKYNLRLGEEKIIILINPMNIVAFPQYDNSKGRCCAYFPVAKAELDDKGDLMELPSGTYSFDYTTETTGKLAELLKNRPLEELMEEGLISNEITKKDFEIVKEVISKSIKSRIIYVQ